MKTIRKPLPKTPGHKAQYLFERLLFAVAWWLAFAYFTPTWARVITAILGTIALITLGAAAWLLLWRDRKT